MTIQNIVLAHERDAAWIIALWKAIHGGDPAPEIVAAQAIASLAQYLHGAANSLTFSQLEKGFASLGVQVTETAGREGAGREVVEEDRIQRPRQYCFKFQGKTICTELPQVKHTQAAA